MVSRIPLNAGRPADHLKSLPAEIVPTGADLVAQVEVLSETEASGAWKYRVQVLDDAGALRTHEVTLSWADYNLWSGTGADEPAAIAVAALMVLLARHSPATLRPRFDLSLVRRLVPEADALVPSAVRGV